MRGLGRNNGDQGLTLIEMLVALAIVTVALFALLGGFLTAAASIQSQQTYSRAVRVALDRNEQLRLEAYDSSELTVGTHTGTSSAPGNVSFSYTTTVTERDAAPGLDVPGDLVKDISTEVRWSSRGTPKSVVYTTSVAQDARSIGLPPGYMQTIRSMSVAPDPSASVNYQGYTSVPVTVTVVMTGHSLGDIVQITWTDDSGSRSVNATTTDSRYWRAQIPAGAAGIKALLDQGESTNIVFTAQTTTGLSATSSLAVWGPVENAPTITAFTVSPNPISMFGNGQNRYQNRTDVNFTCTVSGLDNSATSQDSVKVSYVGETGALVETSLSRSGVSGTSSVWTRVFPRSTTYFGVGDNHLYTCVVTRASDGGPASRTTTVSVR